MDYTKLLIERLKKIIEFLNDNQIDYALAGGLAFSALVKPRATMDIDLLLLINEQELFVMIDQLEDCLGKIIPHKTFMEFNLLKVWRIINIVDNKEIVLDLMVSNSEIQENIIKRAMKIHFAGIDLKIITIEDMVLLKKYSRRPQDIADLDNIYNNLNDEIDHAYIKAWSNKLNIQ